MSGRHESDQKPGMGNLVCMHAAVMMHTTSSKAQTSLPLRSVSAWLTITQICVGMTHRHSDPCPRRFRWRLRVAWLWLSPQTWPVTVSSMCVERFAKRDATWLHWSRTECWMEGFMCLASTQLLLLKAAHDIAKGTRFAPKIWWQAWQRSESSGDNESHSDLLIIKFTAGIMYNNFDVCELLKSAIICDHTTVVWIRIAGCSSTLKDFLKTPHLPGKCKINKCVSAKTECAQQLTTPSENAENTHPLDLYKYNIKRSWFLANTLTQDVVDQDKNQIWWRMGCF